MDEDARMWRLLADNARFRLFLFADLISCFGNGLSGIGVTWFIRELTGDNTSVGMLIAVHVVGGIVMFPFAGWIADRFDRRRVLVVSNAFRAALSVLGAAAVFAGFHPALAIFILAFTSGMGWTVFFPASRGLLQEILSSEEYTRGSGLVETSLQIGTFVSAAAMGLLYVTVGFGTLLVADALTFIASNVLLSRMQHRSSVRPEHLPFLQQIREGFAFLSRHRVLLGYGIVLFLPFVVTMSLNVVMPGYVAVHLRRDAATFGIADMCYGIGAFLAGLCAAGVIRTAGGRFRAIALFFGASIAGLSFLAGNRWVAGLCAACTIVGFANSSLRVTMQAHLMELVPKEFMGRCMSIWLGISMVMHLISSSTVGLLMDAISVPVGFVWLAAVMAAGFVGALLVARALARGALPLHSGTPSATVGVV